MKMEQKVIYNGQILTLTRFWATGEPCLWITDPQQIGMPKMEFVGGHPDEYCIFLKNLTETELSQIKEDNNAYESQVTSDVDLNTIKKLAIGRLGMNYPKDDQKKTYTMPSNSYVRQYQEVPESKR